MRLVNPVVYRLGNTLDWSDTSYSKDFTSVIQNRISETLQSDLRVFFNSFLMSCSVNIQQGVKRGQRATIVVDGVFYRYIQTARVRGLALKSLKRGFFGAEAPAKYLEDSKTYAFRNLDIVELQNRLQVLFPQYAFKLSLFNIYSYAGMHCKIDPTLIRDANIVFHAFKRQNILYTLDTLAILILVGEFNCPALLADLVSQGLARNIRQKQFLRLLQISLKHVQKMQQLSHNLVDCKIAVVGKLEGRERTKAYVISSGSFPFMSLNFSVNYAMFFSDTKFGSFGIKV